MTAAGGLEAELVKQSADSRSTVKREEETEKHSGGLAKGSRGEAGDTRPTWEDLWLVSHLCDQLQWEVRDRKRKRSLICHRCHQALFYDNSANNSKATVVPGSSEGLPWPLVTQLICLLGPFSIPIKGSARVWGLWSSAHPHIFVGWLLKKHSLALSWSCYWSLTT